VIRDILQWPDPRLRRPAEAVAEVTDDIRAIWDDMIDTMEAMQGQGVGLAAPQIGVMLRLAVVDCSTSAGPGDPDGEPRNRRGFRTG
jgi:peptide deformylase